MRTARLLLVLGLVGVMSVRCGDENRATPGRLNVSAAASLTEAFEELGRTFEADHPAIDVTFNFGGSSALAEQIIQGAASDVFASADETSMAKVVDAGDAADPVVFARNRLSIIVEPGNPTGIGTLADLAADEVVVALCAPEVPCGRYAAAALAQAGVELDAATLEENVRAVVAKVTLGEVDAGIVYATDVRAAGVEADGVAIDIANDPDLEALYTIAVTTDSGNRDAAAEWVDFMLSEPGLRALERFGFLAP